MHTPHPPPILVQNVSEKFVSGVTQLRNHMTVSWPYISWNVGSTDSSPMSCNFSTGWVKVHYTTIYRSSTWFDPSTCTEDKSTISLSQLQIYIARHSTDTAAPCLPPLAQDGLKCTIPLYIGVLHGLTFQLVPKTNLQSVCRSCRFTLHVIPQTQQPHILHLKHRMG